MGERIGPEGLDYKKIYTHPNEKRVLRDPLVREVVEFVDEEEKKLPDKNKGVSTGSRNFEFEEGMLLRRPVEVEMIINYLRETGRLVSKNEDSFGRQVLSDQQALELQDKIVEGIGKAVRRVRDPRGRYTGGVIDNQGEREIVG